MCAKIAVTIRSFNAIQSLSTSLKGIGEICYINDTGRHLTEKELCKILEEIDGVIAGTEQFTRSVFESAPNLRVISRVGVGIDNIDSEAVNEYGVTIVNTPEAPVMAVAEHTLALMLTVIKRIVIYNENIRNCNFSIESGLMLNDCNVGIIGLGRIGHKMAEILEMLGCKIFYYDPFLPDGFKSPWFRVEVLYELLEQVDIITLHAPSQPDRKAILDGMAFGYCKRGITVINTSRGSLIDENALAKAIKNGIVWGAGLDVFSNEPYSGKLLDFPQVVVTPHVASNTIKSRQQMENEAIINMINELRQER